MPEASFATLLESERRRQVARYAEPFALTGLLAHLADPQDPSFGPCRQAVVRVYRRVGPGAGEPCGIIRDSESRLAELITGKGLEKHDAHTEQLGFICAHVGLTPAGQPLEGIEQQVGAMGAQVAGVEAGCADTIRRLQGTIGAILAEEEPEKRRQTRKNAMKTHASEALRRTIAEGLIRNVYSEAGLAVPEPLPEELVARVRTGARGVDRVRGPAVAQGRVRRRKPGGAAHPEPQVGPADRLQHRLDARRPAAVAGHGRFRVRRGAGGHGIPRPRAHTGGVRAVANNTVTQSRPGTRAADHHTARHEAAHAVVAARLGLPLMYTDIFDHMPRSGRTRLGRAAAANPAASATGAPGRRGQARARRDRQEQTVAHLASSRGDRLLRGVPARNRRVTALARGVL